MVGQALTNGHSLDYEAPKYQLIYIDRLCWGWTVILTGGIIHGRGNESEFEVGMSERARSLQRWS
jgi:hypothetical protein